MATTDAPATKDTLRERNRARRQELDSTRRDSHDRLIKIRLERALERLRARSVAAFLGFDGEPDLRSLLNDLDAGGVRIALPVLIGGTPPHIELRGWHPAVRMRRNRVGIEEPVDTPVVKPGCIDVVLLPLVAFDERGNRLGMGAGHYDRLLEPVVARPRPLRVGVAYSVQRCATLPVEPWDVPLHAVVTERNWISFDPQNRDNGVAPPKRTGKP